MGSFSKLVKIFDCIRFDCSALAVILCEPQPITKNNNFGSWNLIDERVYFCKKCLEERSVDIVVDRRLQELNPDNIRYSLFEIGKSYVRDAIPNKT